jgi:hypothetical protein
MRALAALIPVAACAGGMYLCMRMMMRRLRHSSSGSEADAAELRDEVARLRGELSERDRVGNQ